MGEGVHLVVGLPAQSDAHAGTPFLQLQDVSSWGFQNFSGTSVPWTRQLCHSCPLGQTASRRKHLQTMTAVSPQSGQARLEPSSLVSITSRSDCMRIVERSSWISLSFAAHCSHGGI